MSDGVVAARPKRAWNKVAREFAPKTVQGFRYSPDCDVYANLPHKETTQYIHDEILEKIKFPVSKLQGIIERPNKVVQFVATTRDDAVKLAELLLSLIHI